MGVENLERREVLSALPVAVVDPALADGFSSSLRQAGTASLPPAEFAPMQALGFDALAAAGRDGSGMGQLPPQQLALSGGGLPPTLVDFWMTQRPGQELTPSGLGGWLGGGEGLNFGALGGVDAWGLPFGSGWGGPIGGNPFGAENPFGALGNPVTNPRDFSGIGGPIVDALFGGTMAGYGQTPLLNPHLGGNTAFDGVEPAQTTPLRVVSSIPTSGAVEDANNVMENVLKDQFERGQRDGIISVSIYKFEQGDKTYTYIERTYKDDFWGGTTSNWKILGLNNDYYEEGTWQETASGTYTTVMVMKIPGAFFGAPERDSKPVGMEWFDSVGYVYANLWIEPPGHDETRIDILINPRSITGETAGGCGRIMVLGNTLIARGGGAAAGPGLVDILPFVGNVDPNPLNPGGPSAQSGLNPVLVAALSLRDPVPIA